MRPDLDHAPFAGPDHDDLVRRFADLGFEPEYGGVHGDGTTQMSVVGFDDGSYLELVAPADGDAEPGLWPALLRDDAGPCAWCVEVDDVAAALKRAIDAGVTVSGPVTMARERPGGATPEWDLGFLGPEGDGALPFLVADRTPRSHRVTPTPGASGGPLTGVAGVVVAVADLDARVREFRRLFRLPTPARTADDRLGAEVADFPGQPVALAEPRGGGRLADRLDRYGPRPSAFLLGAEDLAAAGRAFDLADPVAVGGRTVAWLDADWARGRLGVVESAPP